VTQAVAPLPAATTPPWVGFEPAPLAEIQSVLLDWYGANGRDLAFRRTSDPWPILVSEVMAQQTQAARAAEAWTRFMAQFPTPVSLAAASPATVIRAWRGLGYNRRALALRGAAIAIVAEHDGLVPGNLEALLRLPGIGPYTARAVLAIAFGRPVAALDTNIRRVLGRAFLELRAKPATFQAAADGLVPVDQAAAWTHALMDVGAAFCRPRDPRCEACPLRPSCRYGSRAEPERRAAGTAPSATGRRRPVRFETTSRWLRGRIVDRLRDAPDGAWLELPDPIGDHDGPAVALAAQQLATDGLIEVHPSAGRTTVRFSVAAGQS
jgi:A/G-specific adenine glycosylase